VNHLAGLFDASLDAYRKASRLVGKDIQKQVDLVLRRAEVRRQSGNYTAALRETGSGLRLVEQSSTDGAVSARARIGIERAAIHRWQQRPKEALAEAARAEADARRSGALAPLGRALELLDWAHWMLGETKLAVHSTEALEILEQLGDSAGMSRILNAMGGFAYWEGRWDDAISAYERSAQHCNRIGNYFQEAICHANMAELLINQNRLEEAEPLITESVRVLKASNHQALTFAETELARLLIRQGEFDEAEALLDGIEQRSQELGETMSLLIVALQRADVSMRRGDASEAMNYLAQIDQNATAMAMLGPSVALVRARALAVLGRFEEAMSAVDAGLEQARSQGLLYDEAVLLAARNEITSASGSAPTPDDEREAGRLFGELDIRREPALAS
jgi:tetratricopeptide (TPR) repeat protein